MSYTGSDDQPLCDRCNVMYAEGWPHWITPWPTVGPVFDTTGRIPRDRCDTFDLCQSCVRELVLAAPLLRDQRELAIRSKRRWERSQKLRAEAEAALRPPQPPRRLAG